MKQVFFLFGLSVLVFTGCSDKKKENEVIFNSPEKNGIYSQYVPIDIEFKNEHEPIHEMELLIHEKNNSSVIVFDYDNHVETNYFHLIDTLFVNLSGTTEYTLKLRTGEDVIREESFDFILNP